MPAGELKRPGIAGVIPWAAGQEPRPATFVAEPADEWPAVRQRLSSVS